MDKFSSIVLEHGEVKVTLSGYYPTKGKLQEVFEIDIVGLPIFKVSLNDAELPIINNRATLRSSLNAAFKEIWDVTDERIRQKIQPFQHYMKNNNAKINALVSEYVDGLKHDYMLDSHFRKQKGLMVDLSSRKPYKAVLSFKTARPGYYGIFLTYTCIVHEPGSQNFKRSFTYNRDYPVQNTKYLRGQITEWLKQSKIDHKVCPSTHFKLTKEVLGKFDQLEPLISNALVNLNEGNNL